MRIRIRILPVNLMRIGSTTRLTGVKIFTVLLYVQYMLTVAYRYRTYNFIMVVETLLFIYWYSHDIRKLRTFLDEYLV